MRRTPEFSAAQNRLCIATATFPLGLILAWFAAIEEPGADNDATLSEMVYDWEYASGKIFFGTITITVIFLTGSMYQYYLPNVHYPGPDGQSQKYAILRDVAALSLFIVGVVPVQVESSVSTIVPGHLQMLVHCGAAAVAFGVLLFVEGRLIILHPGLSSRERWYRSVACGMMFASMTLFGATKAISASSHDETVKKLLHGWAFRFELAIGCAFVWSCQLIRFFSDDYLDDEEERNESCSLSIWPVPYFALCLTILYDLWLRGYCILEPGQCALVSVVELVAYAVMSLLGHHTLQYMVMDQAHKQPVDEANKLLEETYGSTCDAKEA